MSPRAPSARAGEWLTIASFLAIAGATLRPSYAGHPPRSPWCLVCGESGVLDVLLNVVLFVPLGAGLALARAPRGKAIGLIVGTTLMVELLQYRVIVGREGTLSDVLTNSLGGTLGLILGPRSTSLMFPTSRLARVLALAGAAAWVVVAAVTAVALQPSLPPPPYRSEWPAPLPGLDAFPGRVASAGVNGRPVPRSGELAGGALRADSLRVDAHVVPGPPPRRVAAIVRVTGDASGASDDEVAVLAQRGTTLVFSTRMRATDWRLKTPRVSVDSVFPAGGAVSGTPRDTVRIWGVRARDAIVVGSESRAGRRTASVALSPSLTWAMLAPFERPLGRAHHTVTALWLLAIVLPLGYWSAWGWSGERRAASAVARSAGVPLGAAVLALAVVPLTFEAAVGHWSEWVTAVMAAMAGWAVHRGVGRDPRQTETPRPRAARPASEEDEPVARGVMT